MERYQADKRVAYGSLEGIEWNNLTEVKKMQEATRLDAPLQVNWSWDYAGQVEELRRLYDISKKRQWNAETDLDWNEPIDRSKQWGQHPKTSPVAQLLKMKGAGEAEVRAAAWESFEYTCSQLLHGEQAAMEICGQLTATCPDMDMKFFAGSQVFDEVRHTEVFAKFISRKLGKIHPIDPNVKFLLEEIMKADSWQKKTLGMQTIFEGMALGVMDMMKNASDVGLFTELITRVLLDESRHAAFGIISMKKTMESAETSPALKAELEDWAFNILECLNAGQYYGVLSALGPKYGIDAHNVAAMMYSSDAAVDAKNVIYAHAVIPHLKKLGLITSRTEEKYRKAGLIKDIAKVRSHSVTTENAWDEGAILPMAKSAASAG